MTAWRNARPAFHARRAALQGGFRGQRDQTAALPDNGSNAIDDRRFSPTPRGPALQRRTRCHRMTADPLRSDRDLPGNLPTLPAFREPATDPAPRSRDATG